MEPSPEGFVKIVDVTGTEGLQGAKDGRFTYEYDRLADAPDDLERTETYEQVIVSVLKEDRETEMAVS